MRPRVAEIIKFVARADRPGEVPEVDLATAVDVAIRDLREILAAWGEESARKQAEECYRLLLHAYDESVEAV